MNQLLVFKKRLMIPLKLILLASVLWSLVQSDKIDVMKVANVPFPNAGCCKPHHWSASASVTLNKCFVNT